MGILDVKWERIAKNAAKRLAEKGAETARSIFEGAAYTGDNDVSVTVESTASGASIEASGASVLFLEFGSGARYGYGHPQAGELGYGPGTWSDGPHGKHHWADEKGWYTPDGEHTYGNPPAMAMYHAAKAIRQSASAVIHEELGK